MRFISIDLNAKAPNDVVSLLSFGYRLRYFAKPLTATYIPFKSPVMVNCADQRYECATNLICLTEYHD